jgi:hypothetical protein
MARLHSSVIFLSRASRAVGGFCVFVWLIAAGIDLFLGPDVASTPNTTLFIAVWPSTVLYLVPGVILFLAGALVRTGRLWAAVIILLISILSLFKLAVLLLPMTGPYFQQPLGCEIPVRLLCALLSVACAYAWEDLVEMNRTRSRRPRGVPRIIQTETPAPAPKPAPPRQRTPPPSTRIPRPKIRRDNPPESKTPWS